MVRPGTGPESIEGKRHGISATKVVNFLHNTLAVKIYGSAQFLVVEDASRPRQSLRMIIRRLLGASRLTTSECSSQSRRQASLPPVLLLIRSDYAQIITMKRGIISDG